MQIVNGYMCQTSCDVSAARAGHDPKNPHDDPVKAQQLNEQKSLAAGRPVEAPSGTASTSAEQGFAADAVSFGGRLAGLSAPRGGSVEVPRLLDRLA